MGKYRGNVLSCLCSTLRSLITVQGTLVQMKIISFINSRKLQKVLSFSLCQVILMKCMNVDIYAHLKIKHRIFLLYIVFYRKKWQNLLYKTWRKLDKYKSTVVSCFMKLGFRKCLFHLRKFAQKVYRSNFVKMLT